MPGSLNLAAGAAAGFASGDVLDTMRPCVTLAGFADDTTGPEGHCDGAPDDQLIGVLRAWARVESWAAERKLAVIAELISPAPGCQPSGPGTMPATWGKFCGDELAAATAASGQAAEKTLTLAYDLASRLRGTARALREGIIDLFKARIIADVTRVLNPADAAAAEALFLRDVASKTPGQLRVAVARAVAQVNPAAAQARRERAQRDARVELWREEAGTAALCGRDLPPADALAADQRITAYAPSRAGPGERDGTAFTREEGAGPPGGYGRWRLRLDGGREFLVDIEPLAILECDHRRQSAGYQPSDKLRHLVEIRDGECTHPPCRRAARRCDFEHAVPWDQGGERVPAMPALAVVTIITRNKPTAGGWSRTCPATTHGRRQRGAPIPAARSYTRCCTPGRGASALATPLTTSSVTTSSLPSPSR